MNKRNMVDLPEDLVVEILSRVPTIALARWRSTSKAWDALVKDGRFSKKHSANAPRQSLVIMLISFRVYLVRVDIRRTQQKRFYPTGKIISQFSLKDPLTNHSEEVDICNVFHCDGLLLCTTKDENRLVVWNPVSGDTKWIPANSYSKFDIFALGYDSKSSCYKIIRMNQHAGGKILQDYPYIYDFTLNSWVTDCAVSMPNNLFIPESRNRGVSVKGITYWLACTRSELLQTILSYDFSTERFQTHSLPHPLLSDVALSVVSENQLCLQDVNPLNVWMASNIESTGVFSWSKIPEKSKNKFTHWMSYLADEQNKVLVCYDNTKDRNNFLHIVAEDTYIQVDHHGTESALSILLSFVPTLVQIKQDI